MRYRFAWIILTTCLLITGCEDDTPTHVHYEKGDTWVTDFRPNSYPAQTFFKDKIYCSSINTYSPNYFYCLDVPTGKTSWSFPVNQWAMFPPVITDSFIYYCSYIGDIYKLDLQGNNIWRRRLSGSYKGHVLVPDTNDLIVSTVEDGLHVFDAKTGWVTSQIGKNLLGIPLPVFSGDTIYTASTKDTLQCKSYSSGKVYWQQKVEGELEKIFIDHDRVYYLDGSPCLKALTHNGAPVWQSAALFDKQKDWPRLTLEKGKLITWDSDYKNMALLDSITGKTVEQNSEEMFRSQGYLQGMKKIYEVNAEGKIYKVVVSNDLYSEDFRTSFRVQIIPPK